MYIYVSLLTTKYCLFFLNCKNEVFVAKICKYALYESSEGFCCGCRKPADPCHPDSEQLGAEQNRAPYITFKAYLRLHEPIFHSHNDEDHDNHPVWVLLPFTTSYNVMFVFLYITMIFTIVFKMQPFSHVRGPHIHRRPCW